MIDYDSLVKKPKIDFKIILVFIVALILVAYTVNLMFGNRSFSKMLDLSSQLKVLDKQVKLLKNKNQILQKEYFELKELEGN